MKDQSLTLVVLPRGVQPTGQLGLSVYVTPRLTGAPTLGDFPDLLAWTKRIVDHGLTFTLSCGGKTADVGATRSVLRPDLWAELFKPDTFVEDPTPPDFHNRLFVSYPARDALRFVKWAYQSLGTGAHGAEGERGLQFVLGGLAFRDSDDNSSTLDQTLAQGRVGEWRRQNFTDGQLGTPNDPTTRGSDPAAAAISGPPDGVPPTTGSLGLDRRATMTRVQLFHRMPPAPNRPALPSTPADFRHTLDFHRALTALASYPSILRVLGLVFDIEIPDTLCPPSPAADAYGQVAVGAITPGAAWGLTPTLVLPATSYTRAAGSFCAAPATPPQFVASGHYDPGDVVDGMLVLPGDLYHLQQVDLDGALLKALALADNLANAKDRATVGEELPALRTAGISLFADGRGNQLKGAVETNFELDSARSTTGAVGRPLNARDVNRGLRLDVWSSRSGRWHSLHRRDAVYRFGATGSLVLAHQDEEGFIQPAIAQPADDPTRPIDAVSQQENIPQPGTDLYVHERVARWDGWSLSAKRPALPLNRSPDPAKALDTDPTVEAPMTPFAMTSAFTVRAGSLPELRFGTHYRVRARAVDIAGNSVAPPADPASQQQQYILPPNGATMPFLRFEPVPPPLVVERNDPGPGGSLERLVIRSFNSAPSLDDTPTAERDERHVAPPKTAVRLAEQHGMFDDAAGHLRGDKATYDTIVGRDRSELPTTDGAAREPGPSLAVNYLPDVFARGAALRDLPNAPEDTDGRVHAGVLDYAALPDVQRRAGSVTFIDFGAAWPERSGFRITLTDGNRPPHWDAGTRVLTIGLAKGTTTRVELSSYADAGDLERMGVWAWLGEYFAARVATFDGADVVALLTRLALEGGHEMLTPARPLDLVHAVQQPLVAPAFTQLPVVHRPTDPILASGLRNSFTPVTAWRSRDSHAAVLLGGMRVHGATSARIDLEARWRERIDDPAHPAPTTAVHADHVETFHLSSLDPGPIAFDATDTRLVGVYVPGVDAIWFSAPFDELDGVPTPGAVAAPVHHFADTKHRWVAYQPVAASRFQEYFGGANLDYTRRGPALMVDVPSSARPAAPEIVYVVPTFGWERQETSNVKSTVRFGNGLRVYLNRGWWSSGEDELLGVLLWPGSAGSPDPAAREADKPFFTQWGNDPIWAGGPLAEVPSIDAFPDAKARARDLRLGETPLRVDVAAHDVVFDPDRQLWYADIQMLAPYSYAPFVRLALARYQPHSVDGVELSHAVLADYAQLTPSRSSVIAIDPADPRRARVTVAGIAPQSPIGSPSVSVTVERRMARVATELGWEAAPPDVVAVLADPPPPGTDAALWSGTIVFAKAPTRGQFRVAIREYEQIPVDTPPTEAALGQRLVYAAIVAYDEPSA